MNGVRVVGGLAGRSEVFMADFRSASVSCISSLMSVGNSTSMSSSDIAGGRPSQIRCLRIRGPGKSTERYRDATIKIVTRPENADLQFSLHTDIPSHRLPVETKLSTHPNSQASNSPCSWVSRTSEAVESKKQKISHGSCISEFQYHINILQSALVVLNGIKVTSLSYLMMLGLTRFFLGPLNSRLPVRGRYLRIQDAVCSLRKCQACRVVLYVILLVEACE